MKAGLEKLSNAAPWICVIFGSIYVFSGGKPWIVIPFDSSFHFDLITVNALFGGFLYTNYSLLLGLLDNSIVEKVKNTQIIAKRNSHILKGITYATCSVVAGLCLILFRPSTTCLFRFLYCFAQNAEIVFMAFLIFYFSLSLKEMSKLVCAIHNQNSARSAEEISELRNLFETGSSSEEIGRQQ